MALLTPLRASREFQMTPCQLLPIILLIHLKTDPAVLSQTCQPHMVLHCGWETRVDPPGCRTLTRTSSWSSTDKVLFKNPLKSYKKPPWVMGVAPAMKTVPQITLVPRKHSRSCLGLAESHAQPSWHLNGNLTGHAVGFTQHPSVTGRCRNVPQFTLLRKGRPLGLAI